jgi:hypothetical protein
MIAFEWTLVEAAPVGPAREDAMSSLLRLPDRVEDFLRAPLAAVMFAMAEGNNLGVDALADPGTACVLASWALSELNPWDGDGSAARTREQALAVVRSRPISELVSNVLADPRNSWWSAPLDRTRQLFLRGQNDQVADPRQISVPVGPITGCETYAQKPERAVITTTELPVGENEEIRSGGHAYLAGGGGGDWCPVYPVEQYRLQVAADARIFEVHSAADWHALAARYGDPGTHRGSNANLRDNAGIDNGLAPTWSAVAADYDGVHLSFAGMLTAVQAPVSDALIGTTTLWAWDWECTHWIRSVFTDTETLPALEERPESSYQSQSWDRSVGI